MGTIKMLQGQLQRMLWTNSGVSMFFKTTELGDMKVFTKDCIHFEVKVHDKPFDNFKVYGLDGMGEVYNMLEEYITDAEETYLNELANYCNSTNEGI